MSVGVCGSAPSSSSRRISSTSAVRAARRNGVAPTKFSPDAPTGSAAWSRAHSRRRLRRRSFRTNSRLPTLPEPSGGGSLLPTSPIFRTHETMCSAVHPRGAAFGLAPRSRKNDASSKCALLAASRNALRLASACPCATPPADLPGIHRQRLVERRAAIEQRAGRLDASFARGEQQRREAGLRPRLDVGAGRDERRERRRRDPRRPPTSVPSGAATARPRSHWRRAPPASSPSRRRRCAPPSSAPFRRPACSVLGSAPAFSSSSMSAALPLRHASESGRTP